MKPTVDMLLLFLVCAVVGVSADLCRGREYDPQVSLCCAGSIRNRAFYVCCDDVLRPSTMGTACCGTTNYNRATSVCCGLSVRPKIFGETACCGPLHYNPSEQICCGDRLYFGIEDMACCGPLLYNTRGFICCDGELRGAFEGSC